MNDNIDFNQLENDAEYIFLHGYACSESVLYTIRKHFELDWTDDVIAMSSGFPWGLGGGGCICGALAGGTMCLGYFFGRRTPGDPCIQKCFRVTNELHDGFQTRFGAACCRQLTKGMNPDTPERKQHCIELVRWTARRTAEIILREYQV